MLRQSAAPGLPGARFTLRGLSAPEVCFGVSGRCVRVPFGWSGAGARSRSGDQVGARIHVRVTAGPASR